MLNLLVWLLLTLSGQQTNTDMQALVEEWANAPAAQIQIAEAALKQVGAPYRYASSDPERGFDCSGLTRFAAASAGIDIPSSSGTQISALEPVLFPEVGDLIWYPGHVAIYLGQGLQVHSAQPGVGVEISDLPDRTLTFAKIGP